ncbi:MAG TPA: hypothetical protein PK765_04865 [bacterium]|nr:hypothetical protein [bacterium]
MSKGILKNDWTDLRTMRQILTNTLPDERKSELRTLLESKGYNPAIIDNIAESPLAGKQVDTLIREGLL